MYVPVLANIQGATQAIASLGTLAGPIGATLGAALIVKQVVDNRNRIIYNSKAIGYRVAKTLENSGLMHRKREPFSTFEKREVERFKQNHQINHTTPPQTQVHSKPYKQKVVHKPPTQSKKTHTSQKVNKIPKGKSRKITVKAGDTPSGLAKKYGVSVEDVMKGAEITDPRKLIAGKTITVTNGGRTATQTKQCFKSESASGTSSGGTSSHHTPSPKPPKKPDEDLDNEKSQKPTSQNQMQRQVEKGTAPKSVDRVDKPHVSGQQPHIHFGENESALNIDGTWHDEGGRKTIPKLTNETTKWIKKNGWSVPK